LSELRIVAEKGMLELAELAAIAGNKRELGLPAAARAALVGLVQRTDMVSSKITALVTKQGAPSSSYSSATERAKRVLKRKHLFVD
jgi:hypothetical protein